MVAEKSLCGGGGGGGGWVTQQNRVTPSPSLLSFEFRLGLLTWTLDSDLDLDCDNFYTKGHLQHRKLLFVLLYGANIFNRLYLYKQLLTLDPNISLSCIFIVDCYLFTFMRAAVRQIFQDLLEWFD